MGPAQCGIGGGRVRLVGCATLRAGAKTSRTEKFLRGGENSPGCGEFPGHGDSRPGIDRDRSFSISRRADARADRESRHRRSRHRRRQRRQSALRKGIWLLGRRKEDAGLPAGHPIPAGFHLQDVYLDRRDAASRAGQAQPGRRRKSVSRLQGSADLWQAHHATRHHDPSFWSRRDHQRPFCRLGERFDAHGQVSADTFARADFSAGDDSGLFELRHHARGIHAAARIWSAV